MTEDQFADDARRYRLESRIATGGMGEVWRAQDTVLGRTVAVKLLKSEYADNPTFRSRFETEARHAASLQHPGVAGVYDFGEAGSTDGSGVQRPYLVMELVDGQPLSALLLPGQPLDPDVTRNLLAQAADALGAAHAAGIVHRDVKPANLLVTPDRTVKITDFGIARATEGLALTETGQVMGTPQYLSPEQAQGGTATPASDVYSLGVVAFECLAGRRPYVAETAVATALAHLRDPVPDLPGDVPADLAAVVRRAMAKSPEDRFPDATAFAAALRDPSSVAAGPPPPPSTEATQVMGAGAAAVGAAAAAGAVMPAPTPADGTPATPPGGRRRVPWGWLLLALAVVIGIVLIAWFALGGEDEPVSPTEPTTSKESKSPRERSSAPTEQTTPTEEQPSQTPTSQSPSETPTETPSETPTETTSPTDSATPEPTPTTDSSSPVTETTPAETSSSPAASTSPSAVSEGGS